MHIPFQLANPGTFTVTDMIADDDNLMQVALIKKHTGVAVVIYMTLSEQKVAIALFKMNPIPAVADEHFADGRLQGAVKLNAIGLRMTPLYLKATDYRKALPLPGLLLHR